MRREHEDIRDLAEEIEQVKDDLRGEALEEGLICSLRRILYGLYTLVKVHVAKEEEIFLPILARQSNLSSAEALPLAGERSALRPTGTGP